jgi:hypothetical protein
MNKVEARQWYANGVSEKREDKPREERRRRKNDVKRYATYHALDAVMDAGISVELPFQLYFVLSGDVMF